MTQPSILQKAQITAKSLVTYAVAASTLLTVFMTEIQSADWFPADMSGQLVKWLVIVIGALGIAVKVLQRVTPVPPEGFQVVVDGGDATGGGVPIDNGGDAVVETMDVLQGWV